MTPSKRERLIEILRAYYKKYSGFPPNTTHDFANQIIALVEEPGAAKRKPVYSPEMERDLDENYISPIPEAFVPVPLSQTELIERGLLAPGEHVFKVRKERRNSLSKRIHRRNCDAVDFYNPSADIESGITSGLICSCDNRRTHPDRRMDHLATIKELTGIIEKQQNSLKEADKWRALARATQAIFRHALAYWRDIKPDDGDSLADTRPEWVDEMKEFLVGFERMEKSDG